MTLHASRTFRYPLLLLLVLCLSFTTQASLADEEADRAQLREMLLNVEKAINDRDLSSVIDYFLPNSVVVFQNKTVLTGPEELQNFFTSMLGSDNSILTNIESAASISAPANFYASDTAVAHGELVDNYSFRGGSEMELTSVWTTTVVRIDEQWRVAALHFSANVFDNPLIDKSKNMLIWSALGGILFGAVLMWLLMRRRKPKG